MSTETLARPRRGALASSTVVVRLIGRRTAGSGAVWGLAFGAYLVYAVLTYAAEYPTHASRLRIGLSLGANTGLVALLGQARQIETMAGFTAWRSVGLLSVLAAVWGLLAATRWLRGEEQSGRWELLLAGKTTRRRATLQGLIGLGIGWISLLAATAAASIFAGSKIEPSVSAQNSLFFALALTSSGAIFLAVGGLASQLASSRRGAATLGAAAIGMAFLVRLVADSASHLGWLRWASPLGWVEQSHPLTGSRPLALLPVVGLVVLLCALSVALAGERDLGQGALPRALGGRPRTWLLNGPTGLSAHMETWTAIGWIAAISVVGMVGGFIAHSVATGGSTTVGEAFTRLGAERDGTDAFLGIIFLLVAVLQLLVAAGQVAALRQEEAEGRLDNLVVRPLRRVRWLGGQLAVGTSILALSGLASGLISWLGVSSQGGDVSLPRLLEAGINTVAPAFFLLGAGTLVYGALPRLATTATYALVAWSFVVQVIGSMVQANRWLLDTSILHHMALAPAAAPDWRAAVELVSLGVAAAITGGVLLSHRDLVSA